MNGPGPCNGYPDYKDMPINQAFYLGAHNAQANDISQALDEGEIFWATKCRVKLTVVQ